MGKSKREIFRSSLHRDWQKNKRKPLRRLKSWVGPLTEAPVSKLHFAKGFLEKHAGKPSDQMKSKVVAELSRRTSNKETVCSTEGAESCVFTIIGNIKHFLKNKTDFHHPNRKEIIKQASSLLDDCFECKRSIYEIRETVGTEDEIESALKMIDAQIATLQEKMKPIADEVSEYTSELERLASILRRY